MQGPEAQSQPDEVEPYPGLQPFTEGESSFFFGRDRLRQQITSNLRASRLTVIFGSSGVGKTSVLRAGVLPHLRRQARDAIEAARTSDSPRPANLPVYFAGWDVDPVEAIPSAVARAIEEGFGHSTAEGTPDTTLEGRFRNWTQETGCRLLIILDQFEEYFVYPRDDADRFGRELGAAIGRTDLPVNVLISIREDAYASLDRFKADLPQIFSNTLRVDHLDRNDAEQAITRPLQEYNRLHPESPAVSAEPKLVERVLSEAATGAQPSLNDNAGRAGTTVGAQSAHRDRIQAPYLQLVIARIWSEERAAGSAVLREATLERLGGSRRIWGHHLDEALDTLSNEEQEDASQLFRFLVTPAGTKFAYTLRDLAALAGVPSEQAARLVEFLADRRQSILRPIEPAEGQTEARYEISHDLLGEAILDWRRRFAEARRTREAERQLWAERQAARARVARTRRRALIGTVVAAAIVAVFAFFALDAQREAMEAQARALLGTARRLADVDRVGALQAALEAWDLAPTTDAESAVRLAMSRLPVRSTLQAPHDGVVWTAAFDHEGDRVVTASADGTALVMDTASGEVLAELRGHSDEVGNAVFTPDDRFVVTASLDGTARIWDSTTGAELQSLSHDAEVGLGSSPFSTDGDLLITYADVSAFIWDVETGEQVAELEDADAFLVNDAAFAGSGLVATAGGDGFVRVREIQDGDVEQEPRWVLASGAIWVNRVAFSPNGRLLATANFDGSTTVFDTGSGELVQRVEDHYDEVRTVSFNSTGTRLLTAGEKRAMIYGIAPAEGDIPAALLDPVVLSPEASFVDSASWSPDGNQVVTAHQDGTARIFDVLRGEETQVLRGHTNILWDARFGPGGDEIVTASEDGSVIVWSLEHSTALRRHALPVLGVEFSPDGSRLATAGTDEIAAVWEATSGELLHELLGEEGLVGHFPVTSAEFSRDGSNILTAQRALFNMVAIWDADTGRQVTVCCEPPEGEFARPDGAAYVGSDPDRAVVFYEDGSLRLWSLLGNRAEWTVDGSRFDGQIISMDISDDGAWLAAVGRKGQAVLWSMEDLTERGTWDVGLTSGIRFADDGRLVTAGLDGFIKVWSLPDWNETSTAPGTSLVIPGVPGGAVVAVLYADDRHWIVAGHPDGRTTVWDLEEGGLLGEMRMHTSGINAVSVTDDGRIATASDDGIAQVYECSECAPIDDVLGRAREILERFGGPETAIE